MTAAFTSMLMGNAATPAEAAIMDVVAKSRLTGEHISDLLGMDSVFIEQCAEAAMLGNQLAGQEGAFEDKLEAERQRLLTEHG